MKLGDKVLYFQQLVTEGDLWKVMVMHEDGSESPQDFLGLMLVYVDDILVVGPSDVRQAVIQAIQAKWETSEPENIGSHQGVRFLGTELWCMSDGEWKMTQVNYTLDMLKRNLGPDVDLWPKKRVPILKDPEEKEGIELKDKEMIREAQRVVGELVWISTKTRPDLCYTVSRMATLITRDPLQVLEMGKVVWAFLAETYDHGLRFKLEPGDRNMNIFTDSSFAETCYGCVLVMRGQGLLLWKSGKQHVLSVSTAESELIELMEGASSGEAVKVVVEEILGERTRTTSYTDNAAAITIVTADSGSWRTRHLRKRASVLRARVAAGEWLVRYQAGVDMPADLGTKVLTVERFHLLKVLMGMFIEDGAKKETGSKKGGVKPVSECTAVALKAIILAAKLAQAKGDLDDQLLDRYSPIQVYRVGSSEDGSMMLWAVTAFVFGTFILIGVLIGMCLAERRLGATFENLEASFERIVVVNRPEFLRREEEDGQEETRDSMSSTAQVNGSQGVRRRRGGANAAAAPAGNGSTAAATPAGSGPSSVTAPAGSGLTDAATPAGSGPNIAAAPAGSRTVAAATPAGSSSATIATPAGSSSATNVAPAGSGPIIAAAPAGSGTNAAVAPAGSSPNIVAAPAGSVTTAAATPAGSSSATSSAPAGLASAQPSPVPAGQLNAAASSAAGGSIPAGSAAVVTFGRGQHVSQNRHVMHISPAGEKVHSSRLCHGLRKAKRIIDIQYCPVCVPNRHNFSSQMFTTGDGDDLHKRAEHVRELGRNDPIRYMTPCSLCFR